MKTLTLNNGAEMPAFGLGTWKSAPGEVRAAVIEAVKLGYRHIDCAWIYGNEAEIGQALAELFAEGVVTRQDLWITSKLWNDRHAPQDVSGALRETLDKLGLESLDLYLIHWPIAFERGVTYPRTGAQMRSLQEVPLASTWEAMEALVDAGLCRSVGVSNFSVKKLAALLDVARIKPAVNQIELHPYLQQPQMLSFCQAHQIALTAYSPLGSKDRPARLVNADVPILLEDPVVAEVAAARGASSAQVLIAWALERGTSVIPKSVNPARLAQNLEAAALSLTPQDMARLDALDQHQRFIDGAFWVRPDGPYTLANLWDEDVI